MLKPFIPNVKALKIALYERDLRQKDVATGVRMHPTILSGVVNGARNVSEEEATRISSFLGKNRDSLFYFGSDLF